MKTRIFHSIILGILALTLAGAAWSDTLELRSGQLIQGKFLGGSPLNIRFQVNGQEQVFATKDVLNISFSDVTADASAPDATNATPEPPQEPPADATANVPVEVPANATADSSGQPAQAIMIPAGTSLLVRMIDTVDSSKNSVGDAFHASLETQLVVGDTIVAPKGADVYGKLAQVKEAGKISGGAQLTLELTGLRINGTVVPVYSTEYDVAGKGRGKQSAGRIGGGAALGAIIGGIAGGGTGAAIGAGVGAAAGTTVQLVTHGEKIRIPSETLLEFKLQQDVAAPLRNPTAPPPNPSN
ncbi:MAG: hypothetical protein WBP79_11375 [Candidatus Acidiferrales bacterium]